MNYLWGGMMLLGIVYGACTGHMQEITDAVISSSREAVSLCISMSGVLALWCGLMEIAKDTGLVDRLSAAMNPVITFLFPAIPQHHPSREYLSTNIIANILGLGWAATPAGLKAMESLSELEEERRHGKGIKAQPKGFASNEMCTFLIINISSLQLIPINIIAYRSQYGSLNPTAIVGPGIVETALSTAVAVIFCKCINRTHTP